MGQGGLQDPARRYLLATLALALPACESLSQQPKSDSYNEWFEAIRIDDSQTLRALLARGFDPNSIEPVRYDTGLILAVRSKSRKVFALLLRNPKIKLDEHSRNGDTALMLAAFQSDTASALALIDKGAAINHPGWTALHYAAASGNMTIVRRLLEKSAYIDAESPNGTTPLMMAARGGRVEIIRLLLEEGADVSLKNERGMSAADFARAQGFDALAQELDAAIDTSSTLPASAD